MHVIKEKTDKKCSGRPIKTTGFKVDHTLFMGDVNPKISYILGFLWADGHVSGKNGQVNLELVKEDILDLMKIFEFVGDWSYYERQRKRDNKNFGRVQGKLSTSNKLLCEFLISMDYRNKNNGPQKILDHIGKENHIHFWHGYFDGDGALYVSSTGRGKSLQFWSTIEQNWKPFIDFLNSLDIKHTFWKYERLKPSGSIHRSSCVGVKYMEDARSLLRLFYENEIVGLERKYQKYLNLCIKLDAKRISKRRKYKSESFHPT